MARSICAVLVALCAALALPASAEQPSARTQPACHEHGELVRQLERRYGEQPVSMGLQANGHLLQVFASRATGSWTILSTSPKGLACIVAVGRGWQTLEAPSEGPLI